MKSLYRTLKNSLTIILLGGIFCAFGWFWSARFFPLYETLFEYRRLSPDVVPTEKAVQMTVAGHENLYADIAWIRLIQFIADNMGNGKYLEFTHTILSHITKISPYFERAYEADLLFAPTIFAEEEGPDIEKYKQLTQGIVNHAEVSLPLFCDMKKVEIIANSSISEKLWQRNDLKNPCSSGKIAYYMASRLLNDLHDGKKASIYYTLASMHDDVPEVSRILAILSLSENGQYDKSALTFLLLAQNGYDFPPYTCQNIASQTSEYILSRKPWNENFIKSLQKGENELLLSEKQKKDIFSHATDGCFELFERGLKQIYLGYITEKTKDFPDVETAEGILSGDILKDIPYISSQKDGFTVKKRDGVWRYRKILQ